MRRVLGLIAAGGLWLGSASSADAQFSMSIGNPYAGGFSIGVPSVGAYGGLYGVPYSSYGYGYGGGMLPGATLYSSGYYGMTPGVTTYSSGYYGMTPGVTTYSSGYYGLAPSVSAFAYPYGYTSYYGYAPYYRYGYYGGGPRWGWRGGWGGFR